MPLVKMAHPELGDAQVIEVDERSATHYKRSGWEVVSAGVRKAAAGPKATRPSEETK